MGLVQTKTGKLSPTVTRAELFDFLLVLGNRIGSLHLETLFTALHEGIDPRLHFAGRKIVLPRNIDYRGALP